MRNKPSKWKDHAAAAGSVAGEEGKMWLVVRLRDGHRTCTNAALRSLVSVISYTHQTTDCFTRTIHKQPTFLFIGFQPLYSREPHSHSRSCVKKHRNAPNHIIPQHVFSTDR